jgi:hypothetical protein
MVTNTTSPPRATSRPSELTADGRKPLRITAFLPATAERHSGFSVSSALHHRRRRQCLRLARPPVAPFSSESLRDAHRLLQHAATSPDAAEGAISGRQEASTLATRRPKALAAGPLPAERNAYGFRERRQARHLAHRRKVPPPCESRTIAGASAGLAPRMWDAEGGPHHGGMIADARVRPSCHRAVTWSAARGIEPTSRETRPSGASSRAFGRPRQFARFAIRE